MSLYVPIAVVVMFVVAITYGGVAVLCLAIGLCIGSLTQAYGLND